MPGELAITGPGKGWRVPLKPEGMTLGRQADCEVALEDRSVSRQHARLSRDPFGRWVVEDLGSHNGVWVGGASVRVQALRPLEEFRIGPFALRVEEEEPRDLPAHPIFTTTTSVSIEPEGATDLRSKAGQEERLSADRLKQLDQLADEMARLPDAGALYPTVCRHLATSEGGVAMVLRLPVGEEPLPVNPPALAMCHGEGAAKGPPCLHVSRRVLEAVRSSGNSILGGGGSGGQTELTVVDSRSPRTVLCAPILRSRTALDVLYLDVQAQDAAETLLDYVQAVARHAGFASKALRAGEAQAERKALDLQLKMAKDILAKFAPPLLTTLPGAEVAVHYQPALWVGGDYCDVWQLPDGRLALAVGDVSGKGLPAAMVMTCLRTAARTVLPLCPSLPDAMGRINRHLKEHTPDDMFVTLVLGLFDPASAALEYVNAGHITPLFVPPGEKPRPMGQPANPPLGVVDCAFEASSQSLPLGSALVVVTDGITEAASPSGEMFGDDRLLDVVAESTWASSQAVADRITRAATEFRKPLGQQDDTTVLAFLRR